MIILLKGGDLKEIDDDGKLKSLDCDLEFYMNERSEYCTMEEGVTIEDLFLMINKNIDYFVERFSPLITTFIDDIRSEDTIECPIENLTFKWLCIQKNNFLEEHLLAYPLFNQDYYKAISEMQDDNLELQENPFSLNNFLLSDLKSAEIILDEEYKIYDYEKIYNNGDITIKPESEYVFYSKKRFKFVDIVDEIIMMLCPELEYDIENFINDEDDKKEILAIDVTKNENKIKEKNIFDDMYKKINDLDEML